MPGEWKADVIIPLERDSFLDLHCVENVLEHAGKTLRRLVLIEDYAPESELSSAVERLAHADARVRLVKSVPGAASIDSCNRGLAERIGDAVLLSSACRVSGDWLDELAAVAHSDERTACASPIGGGAESCCVAGPSGLSSTFPLDTAAVDAVCAGLPRWTVAPVVSSSCLYLRGEVIDAVGLLDPKLTSVSAAVDNWVVQALALGFVAKRANHVYVARLAPGASGDEVPAPLDRARARAKLPVHVQHQLEQFRKTLDAHLAAHAVGLHATGKLRVALDIRHLPREQVGTRTHAVCLAQALAALPELELTLLVREPVQAEGLAGRVVVSHEWKDDVAVIHKPAQVSDPQELKLLFGSSAHVVITYQDLIGYRVPVAWASDLEFDLYRATSRLSLPAAQRIVAFSKTVAEEITAEFGIPREEICVVPLGVEAEWFVHKEQRDDLVLKRLGLPAWYFFSIAADFPHKNLPNLLEAYELVRSHWRDGEPPGLVLAGYRSAARASFYERLESGPRGEGVVYLGPISRNQLRVLYQRALALVFPSLYEGFGLPPLEAMAAGAPVIAMPISSVPEVGGDCVLYTEGLTAADLAHAMASLAKSDTLHQELRERGLARVEQFRWEQTARTTLEIYRSAVLHPSQRSLQTRRLLRDAIMSWAEPNSANSLLDLYAGNDPAVFGQSIGIRNAWKALNFALRSRVRRELRRLPRFRQRRPA